MIKNLKRLIKLENDKSELRSFDNLKGINFNNFLTIKKIRSFKIFFFLLSLLFLFSNYFFVKVIFLFSLVANLIIEIKTFPYFEFANNVIDDYNKIEEIQKKICDLEIELKSKKDLQII